MPPFSRLAIFRLAPRKKGVNGDAFEMPGNRREASEINDLLQTTGRSFVPEIAAIRRSSPKQLHAGFSGTSVRHARRRTDGGKIAPDIALATAAARRTIRGVCETLVRRCINIKKRNRVLVAVQFRSSTIPCKNEKEPHTYTQKRNKNSTKLTTSFLISVSLAV